MIAIRLVDELANEINIRRRKYGWMAQYMYRTDMWNVLWRMRRGDGAVAPPFV